jgi:hypothetical protein
MKNLFAAQQNEKKIFSEKIPRFTVNSINIIFFNK